MDSHGVFFPAVRRAIRPFSSLFRSLSRVFLRAWMMSHSSSVCDRAYDHAGRPVHVSTLGSDRLINRRRRIVGCVSCRRVFSLNLFNRSRLLITLRMRRSAGVDPTGRGSESAPLFYIPQNCRKSPNCKC